MIAFHGSSHNYYLLTCLFVKQFINIILFTLQLLCKTEVAIMLFYKNKELRNTNHCGHGTKVLLAPVLGWLLRHTVLAG